MFLKLSGDGTWNRLSSPYPTNVVLTTEAVLPRGPDGILQSAYYNEGVGTSYLVFPKLAAWIGGGFGLGLFDKVADAYRFLVMNYEIGDEIYIFGFSRGAFTARSLAGMIRNCGIIERGHIDKVPKAVNFYETRTPDMHPDSEAAKKFRATHAYRILMDEDEREWRRTKNRARPELDQLPLFRITFLGVWDTVGALGIPKHLFFEKIFRTADKYRFHDTVLSSRVASARHAVAIDEDRKSFAPSLWDNLDELNEATGNRGEYQQLWFPGDHSSVGGGGDIVGLSADALIWILEGAERKGLALDQERIAALHERIDCLAPLRNRTEKPGLMARIYQRAPREGPTLWDDLSPSAQTRLLSETKSADFVPPYRPKSLERLFPEIERRRGR